MSKVINEIVIVGGGSAGWMTASILIKDFPNKKITLIESPDIPKVGVGESTYDGINHFVKYLDIDRDDFFTFTNASIKLGIEFENFYENNDTSFVYPFGWAYLNNSFWGMQDWLIRKHKDSSIPVTDFVKTYFPVSHLIEYNTFNENKNNELPNFIPEIHTALHFDAQKFALWLQEKYAKVRGVNHIISTVKNIKQNKDGIESLTLADNTKISADLFIDCTVFGALLIDKTLKEEFIDYTDRLPNNSAWATTISYVDIEKELTGVTKCTFLNNGWVWNIPLYSRIGTGYVYSDKFINDDDALKEFKNYLLDKNLTNVNFKEEIDNLNFKNIKMRVGIHKNTWVKNVAAIGLAAGFIEPLESNGLFTVHEFLFNLVSILKEEKITSWHIHTYNEKNYRIYDSFAQFIQSHYALSARDDSKYWKANSEKKYSFDKININNKESSFLFKLYDRKTRTSETFGHGGFDTGLTCVAIGMNYLILDSVSTQVGEIVSNQNYSTLLQNYWELSDKEKIKWNEVAKQSETMYAYLRRKYHNDK